MYPIYDRSGVDDDTPRPLAQSAAPSPSARSAPLACEVLVCHAGTCRQAGAEAVLTEIEELVNASGGSDYCTVRQSGCLGYCSEAPNAVVRQKLSRSGTTVHMRLRSMEASAKVAERATGTKLALLDGPANGRLQELRLARARQHAVSACHWNAALNGLAERAAQRPALRAELTALLARAGFPDATLATMSSNQALPAGAWPRLAVGGAMPSAIESYSLWSVQGVTPVSQHSAIFHLTSADRKRGTPHPRGNGRLPVPVTWHVTLQASHSGQAEPRAPTPAASPYPSSHSRAASQARRCGARGAQGSGPAVRKPPVGLGCPALAAPSGRFRHCELM